MDEQTDKAVTKTVSMPESLWSAIDGHSSHEGEDRSSYLRRLARADLQAAGKLPGSENAAALAEALDLLQTIGADRFRETLRAAALANA